MSEQTMKAVRIHDFGGPEVLTYDDAPVPVPGPGEVLVRVSATALNPPDWYAREGFPDVPRDLVSPMELPMILGTDVSGVVEEVGDGVEGFAAGDEVFGLLRFPAAFQSGAYAEYVTAPAADLAHKPAGISHADAAGVAMAGLTAWQFLIELGHDHPSPFQEAQHRPVPITSGMTVLVNGAAGGVGHLGLQLAKWKGARVIAVASGPHEEFLRDLGADEFIDYTKAHPEELVRGVDLVLDTVGGAQSHRFLRVLKRGGALFPVYMAAYDPDEVERLGITTTSTQVRASGAQLEELAALIEAGALRVAIDSTYPLAEARAAHERATRGHIQGQADPHGRMTALKHAIDDLFDPRLPVEEAFARHFAAEFRQRVNGADWIDRPAFLAGIARVREDVDDVTVTVLDELADGDRYAERHRIELVGRDGARAVQEVYVFAQRDADGRFMQIEEAAVAAQDQPPGR